MSSNDPIQRMFNRITDKVTDGIIQAVLGLVAMFIRPLATLTEIFFRKDFGERYYTFWNWYAGCILTTIAWICILIGVGLTSTQETYMDSRGLIHTQTIVAPASTFSLTVLGLWAWGLHIFTVIQWWSVRRRYQRGGRWHSRSIGVPWIPKFPAWAERAIPLGLGFILVRFGATIPGVLMIASAATTLLLRWKEARDFKNRVLDVIDGQIEQEYLGKAVMERTGPREAEGFRAPLPAYVSQSFRQKVVAALADRQVEDIQVPQGDSPRQ